MSEPSTSSSSSKTQEERDAEKRTLEDAHERRLADLTASLVSYGDALATNPHIRITFLRKHNLKHIETVHTGTLRVYVFEHVERIVRENVARGVEGLNYGELVKGLSAIFDMEFLDDIHENIKEAAECAYYAHTRDYKTEVKDLWRKGESRDERL